MFLFVCQAGELELQAGLLASSLRRFHSPGLELRACIPESSQPIQASTLDLLGELQVEVVRVESPFGDSYPIGNKMACLASAQDGHFCLFLDTDLLCVEPVDLMRVQGGQVCAKPADKYTLENTGVNWKQIYEIAGVRMPKGGVFSTVEGQYMPHYYNSGVLGTRRASSLGQTWIEIARKIERCPDVPAKRPWLDQISLPVAIAALGMTVTHLSERENFPLNNLRLPSRKSKRFPSLVHYHRPGFLLSEPDLVDDIHQLCRRYPALRTLNLNADWQSVFNNRFPTRGRRKQAGAVQTPTDLVITGIPRSGTSFLTYCLHEQSDLVAINEPDDLNELLVARQPIQQLRLYFRELRRRILCGEAVGNKVDDRGSVVQDTLHQDDVRFSQIDVRYRDFVLAVKNPLAFMGRLPMLIEGEGDLAVVACIRNPLDTIGSWVSSFDHLRLADLASFPLQGLEDPHLTRWQREQLSRLADEPAPEVRRCLLWRYLAELIWKYQTGLRLVRYESLCSDLNSTLSEVIGENRLTRRLSHISPKRSRDNLSGEEQNLVINLCGDLAERFGYRL